MKLTSFRLTREMNSSSSNIPPWSESRQRTSSISSSTDFLVEQFTDPDNGIREQYVCHRSFKTRDAAERVVSWLHQAEKERSFGGWTVLESEIMEEPEGSYRMNAGRFQNGHPTRVARRNREFLETLLHGAWHSMRAGTACLVIEDSHLRFGLRLQIGPGA
jgi:hypothetical protein